MSHAGGDNGDNSSSIHAWNRTPGKPNLTSLAGNVNSAAPWGGKAFSLSSHALLGDSAAVSDVWSAIPDSINSRKNDTSPQWPTPAELAGGSRGDTLCDFAISNSWNAPGTTLALRSISESNDQADSWPPLDSTQSNINLEHSNAPRPIIGVRNIAIGNDAFNPRQHLSSVSSSKPRGESFSSWGSQTDGDFNAFPNQPIASTSENKRAKDRSQSGECLGAQACSSVSDSGNHTDAQSETSTVISALINSKEWGTRPVDQSTPWDITSILHEEANGVVGSGASTQCAYGQSSTVLLGETVSLANNTRREIKGSGGNVACKGGVAATTESNVWASEPPNGTAIWEIHYESIGEKPGRWKQDTLSATTSESLGTGASTVMPSGNSSLGGANSPPGPHRVAATVNNSTATGGSAFVPPTTTQSPPALAASAQQRQFSSPNFFPSPQQQSQQRFGQPPQVNHQFSGFPQPPGAAGRGSGGLNGIFSGGSFRSLQSAAPGSSQGWPLSLTPDNSSPIDDPKRFINSSTWGDTSGRAIGKQQPDLAGRWAAPSPTESPWSSSNDLIRSANNGLQPSSSSRPPWHQPQQQLSQRFQPRQNVPPSTGAIAPPRHNVSLIRTEVARQLFALGFHDEASILSDHQIDDIERFLYELRDRVGGGHFGLNHLINAVSTMLPPQPPQPFDMYGAAAGMFQPPAPPSKTVLGSIPPPGVSGGPSFFGKMTSQHQQGEIMGQLALRDAQLRQNIAHLDKKRRELNLKHAQVRKMTGTTHHSHPMIQEILIQQAQISQQIEAQEAQLNQLNAQMAFFGGSNNSSSTPSVAAHRMIDQHQEAVLMMRIRGSGGVPPRGSSSSSITGFGGGVGGYGPRGPMMIQSSSPVSSDLSSRMGEIKLGSGGDLMRRMPWESSGAWDAPPAFHAPSNLGGLPPPSAGALDTTSVNSTSVFSGDRRWPSQQQPSDPSSHFSENRFPWGTSTGGGVGGSAWLLLTDITPQFSLELLRMTLEQVCHSSGIGGGGDLAPEIHPNLAARYVLVGFSSLMEASSFISSCGYKLGTMEIISTATAMTKLQEIKNLAVQVDQEDPSQQQGSSQAGQTNPAASLAQWPSAEHTTSRTPSASNNDL